MSRTEFLPFEGAETKTGKGGFADREVSGVAFYTKGLPDGKSCTTIGKARDRRFRGEWGYGSVHQKVAGKAVQAGANTAVFASKRSEVVGRNALDARKAERMEYTTFTLYDCK